MYLVIMWVDLGTVPNWFFFLDIHFFLVEDIYLILKISDTEIPCYE